MKHLLEEQIKEINKKEELFLQGKDNTYLNQKINPLLDKVRDKIPANLKSTLDKAFFKAFELIYEKGIDVIEKTYNKNSILVDYDINNQAVNKKLTKKHIKDLDNPSLISSRFNSAFSVVEGSVLGLFGIGLPDIPVFLGLIIKSINEISLSYGFSNDKEEEKAYLLLLIQASLLKGKEQRELNMRIDQLAYDIENGTVPAINIKKEMKAASSCFSEALLTAKFIQGTPIVGAIGGVFNHSYIKKITAYSQIKYKKRYLLKKVNEQYANTITD
jgi:hypothetical protein